MSDNQENKTNSNSDVNNKQEHSNKQTTTNSTNSNSTTKNESNNQQGSSNNSSINKSNNKDIINNTANNTTTTNSNQTSGVTNNNSNFQANQKEEIKELLSSDYLDLWDNIIYGTNTNGWIFPVGGIYTITTQFSEEHEALDIASSYGSEIYAIDDGIVIISKEECIIGDLTSNGKAGNYVTIKHNDNIYYSSYMHLKNVSVKVGDKIKKGQVIGYMGNTGNVIPIPDNEYSTNGIHLHFILYRYESNSFEKTYINLYNVMLIYIR